VDITVLIGGETGTGKELVARAIHHLSPRRDRPFVKVNCAAVPAELLESELFGHERGAFTGAHQLRVGKFEAADRGVVFLDEIGDLHLSLQAKLLHVLQDGAFSRVGGRSTLKVDVRIVAATNRDLEIDVAEGRFREDLYYRLNVVQIIVPPLRERAAEIPLLTDYFVKRDARLFGHDGFAVSPVAMERLMRHQYPGNVRELENMVKRMVVLNDPLLERVPLGPRRSPIEEPSRGSGLPPDRVSPSDRVSLKEISRAAARAAEREAIARVLKETRWNRVRAAKLLGISYRALLYKIKDVGLAAEPALPVGS
jgi:two-component system response regulator AtoC